jgi:hypothetical protein
MEVLHVLKLPKAIFDKTSLSAKIYYKRKNESFNRVLKVNSNNSYLYPTLKTAFRKAKNA